MTSSRITSTLAAIAAVTFSTAGVGPTQAAHATVARKAQAHDTTRAATTAKYAYAWPVKPFRQQHPVRGFFGDPRIANDGESRQFHFGIDISAPNGTAVYATLTGTASIHPLHETTILIDGNEEVEFSYWHVVPSVRNGQRVVAYRTIIGHIEEPYGHVHFSEARRGRYLNPLRPGSLGPYADSTRPTTRSVNIVDGALIAETYDKTPLAVPRPWQDLPVMPALVQWRLLDERGHVVRGWETVVDFRLTIPPASAFDEIWAPGTTQNHVRAPGCYRLVLTRSLADLRGGLHLAELAVSDSRGNASRARFPIGLSTP